MLTKFNLYIGLNDKDSKVQEISTIDATRPNNRLQRLYANKLIVN